MSLRTRQKALATAKPQFMATKDVPLDIEIEASLEKAAHLNDKGNVVRNQYRGRLDGAGTVRARVYVGGLKTYMQFAGSIYKVNFDDATLIVDTDEDGRKFTKVEWDDVAEKGVLLIAWVPLDYDGKTFKVTIA